MAYWNWKEWAARNPEKRAAAWKEWVARNPEKRAATNRKYRLKNKSKYAHHQATRRARLSGQTPSWYCDWMVEEIYEACPEGMEVDHIQPLSKGGLHSHENLQYLTAEENRMKSDKEHGGLFCQR